MSRPMPSRPSPARVDQHSAAPKPDASRPASVPPTALLDSLHAALQSAVGRLAVEASTAPVIKRMEGDGSAFSVPVASAVFPRSEASRTDVVAVEGALGTVHVHLSVVPHRDAPALSLPSLSSYTVKASIQDGPCVRYTVRAPVEAASDSTAVPLLSPLRHKAESFFRQELGERLGAPASDVPPRIILDADGRIQALSSTARTALEYGPDASPPPNFFSHVAGCSLGQVLRDLGRMVNGDRRRARWLLRLRTGTGRWCWYRAVATHNRPADNTITVTAWPLSPRVASSAPPPRPANAPRREA